MIRSIMRDLKRRRQILSITSASLILLGLGAKYLLAQPGIHDFLMIAAALTAGWDIALRAWVSLRNRAFSIELLVTIATVGALVIGEYWEAAAVTFLFIFGAYLEAQTLSRTRKVIADLLDLAPTTALVLRNGETFEVSPGEVEIGEMVLLKPGAKIPVDGSVVDGRSAVDESAITGEPFPEEKTSGNQVFAGTVNLDGMLKIRATGVGADTTLARIISRVEEAQEEKAPTQRFIERFARWYTPGIIVLSILVFIISGDLNLSLTLLVISCPGALVISTPVSVVAGIGRAAQKGILIKGGEYLENAGKITALGLDKTGTLTQGKPRLTDIVILHPLPENFTQNLSSLSSSNWSSEQSAVLYLAAIAEISSEHPLARPILQEANQAANPVPHPSSFETKTGKGVLAFHDGSQIAVGTAEFFAELEISIDKDVMAQLGQMKSSGKTAVIVSLDHQAIGLLGITDEICPQAPVMVAGLRKTGIQEIVMLTGDDALTARQIAQAAGITNVHAGLLPDDKLAVIRTLQAQGHVVAMVGDGINDAPALAAADIGIAMGAAGTDVAIETADIALMADDLMKIPEAIRLSKASLRNIRQNTVIALGTVGLLLAGVLLGEVHMAAGMLIHQASVLLVILNGMRLMKA